MLVAEQMQETMHERLSPGLAGDLRAENRVAELAWHSCRQALAAVDRKRKHVGRLVDLQMLAVQGADLVRADEQEAELRFLDSFGRKHVAGKLTRALLVDLDAASIRDFDGDHVPICSARCRSPPRAACTPPRFAARACA